MTPTAARRRFTVTAARTAVALVVAGVPVLVACGDTTERSAAAATSTTVAASSTMVAPAKRATAAEHLAKGLVDVSGSFASAPSTEHVLLVPGSSFNLADRRHFRVTLLPQAPELREVFARIERALARAAERADGAALGSDVALA